MNPWDNDSTTQPTQTAVNLRADDISTVVDGKLDQGLLERGTAIGRYTVLDVLGRGGMGVVYRAYDPELNRNVALKLLRVRRATAETAERARARMLREAQALARLSHPNVIAVYDTGTFEDDVFITMELVDGDSLSDWLKQTARSHSEILEVFIAAGRGLGAAHAAGLIHRDFKPSNVMVGLDGRVRVLDFGLAKAAGSDSEDRPFPSDDSPQPRHPNALDSPLTLQGHIVGTPKYMAPEQLRGRPVDPRSDQYGFCVALFRALTGQFPFRAERLSELLQAMADGKIRDAPNDRKLSAWLRRALHRGLSYDAVDRFESMTELLFELGRQRLRRRQIAAYAGLGIAAVATVGVLLTRPTQGVAKCPVPATYLANVWDADIAKALGRAFQTSGRPHAKTTSKQVSRALNKYAERWQRMRHSACVDTRERQVRSATLFDLRVQCLEQRRDQMAALTSLFIAEASPAVVDRAVAAVAKLPVLGDCRPSQLLLSRVPPPKDAQTRAQIVKLRRRLATARAAYHAGKYPRARSLLSALATQAGSVGYEPFVARVSLVRASLFDDIDDRDRADKALRKTIELAAVHLDHHTEAQAWIQLLWVVGYRKAQHKQAGQLILAATAAVARAGNDPWLRAQLHNNIGSVLYARGDYKAALKAFIEGLRLRRVASGDDDVQIASGLTNLGLVHYKQGDYAKALEYHRKAYRIRVRGLGETHPTTASSLNNLGIIAERQGRYSDARALYLKALAVRERVLGKNHKKLAGLLNNLGNIYFQEGKLAAASKFLNRALVLKQKAHGPDHPRLTSTLDNLAGVLMKQQRHAAALKLLQRSLAIATKSLPANHPDIAYTLTALGECYRTLGKRTEAVTALERALKLQRAIKLPGPDQAQTQFELARALWLNKRSRGRARALATAARVVYVKAGHKMASKVERWLAGR